MSRDDEKPGLIRRVWRAFRSAITGRFVSRKFAQAHPSETVSERRER